MSAEACPVHVRTIRCQARQVGEDTLEVVGRLVVPPLQELVGLSVARGFTRAVNERVGRERGCAHMVALIHAMAPVVKQGAGAGRDEDTQPPPPEGEAWFVDSCQARACARCPRARRDPGQGAARDPTGDQRRAAARAPSDPDDGARGPGHRPAPADRPRALPWLPRPGRARRSRG